VTARTYHGARYLLDVVVEGHEALRVAVPVTAVAAPDVGDTVTVEPVPGAAVTLDR
jgi:hypothetical protein